MIENSKEFMLFNVYDYAAMVEQCVDNSQTFLEVWLLDEPSIAISLYRPTRLGILNRYIYAMISTWLRREYRKNSDCYEFEEIEGLERCFEVYSVKFIDYSTFLEKCNGVDFPECERFYEWFLLNEEAFNSYWEKIADEVFHIMFANRGFLIRFSESLAEFVEDYFSVFIKTIKTDSNSIARYPQVPSWLKKGVFFRDGGRCVLCRVDLSGLHATDRTLHYDHIVPLARYGTNDPSNYQLLCKKCNLKKSASNPVTGSHYNAWWDY